jgi:hypothetical protein
MAHEPDLNLLAAFAERRLSDAERDRLIGHLAGCGPCRDTLALLLRAGIDAPVQQSRRGIRSAVWMPVAASVAIIVLGALVVGRIDSRLSPRGLPASTPEQSQTSRAQSAAPPPSPSSPSSARAPHIEETTRQRGRTNSGEDLARRRGGERRVGKKLFRMVAGEWIDADYDRLTGLPEVEVTADSDRRALLARIPALVPYAALGSRVTVVHAGTVYRFSQ